MKTILTLIQTANNPALINLDYNTDKGMPA